LFLTRRGVFYLYYTCVEVIIIFTKNAINEIVVTLLVCALTYNKHKINKQVLQFIKITERI